ncbi:MAG: glutamine--fructose-6-phosphate transaminase (isomerizing) [Dehalococcoidia bacterium]
MCGIIGYCGSKPVLPTILEGLKRLEYRGYDSAGFAIIEPQGTLAVRKSAGKLADLLAGMGGAVEGTVGMGHTRWATHGRPTVENAHPQSDCTGAIAVIHNGIVENYRELKQRLERAGHRFRSQTDTEVIAHLIEGHLAGGAKVEEAAVKAGNELAGAQAIAVLSRDEPDQLVGMRIGHAGGLAVGYGPDAMYLASDLPAIVGEADNVVYLENREVATITRTGARFVDLNGSTLAKEPVPVVHDPVAAAKGPYRHFMLKEIMEQPETVVSALRGRVDFRRMRATLPDFPLTAAQAKQLERVMLIGMGTSFHAAQVGRSMIERLARIPAEVENASEFRYRDPVIGASTLVVSVAQSGETVDTLVAMGEAKRRGARQITLCNVPGAESTRIADYTILINAGPEIAVASTKTLVGSMVCLFLLALTLGQLRGTVKADERRRLIGELAHLPEAVGEVLEDEAAYEALARRYAHYGNFLVLGRGVTYPIAMEGALKLKEISYIHAEGYQAGEMKHGPIALIDEQMAVVAIALKDRLYDKMISNIEQVRARDGQVIAIATVGDDVIQEHARDVLFVPAVSELLSPVVAVAPLQLLAYHIAVRRGCDVDQPRNLAKTVTVE